MARSTAAWWWLASTLCFAVAMGQAAEAPLRLRSAVPGALMQLDEQARAKAHVCVPLGPLQKAHPVCGDFWTLLKTQAGYDSVAHVPNKRVWWEPEPDLLSNRATREKCARVWMVVQCASDFRVCLDPPGDSDKPKKPVLLWPGSTDRGDTWKSILEEHPALTSCFSEDDLFLSGYKPEHTQSLENVPQSPQKLKMSVEYRAVLIAKLGEMLSDEDNGFKWKDAVEQGPCTAKTLDRADSLPCPADLTVPAGFADCHSHYYRLLVEWMARKDCPEPNCTEKALLMGVVAKGLAVNMQGFCSLEWSDVKDLPRECGPLDHLRVYMAVRARYCKGAALTPCVINAADGTVVCSSDGGGGSAGVTIGVEITPGVPGPPVTPGVPESLAANSKCEEQLARRLQRAIRTVFHGVTSSDYCALTDPKRAALFCASLNPAGSDFFVKYMDASCASVSLSLPDLCTAQLEEMLPESCDRDGKWIVPVPDPDSEVATANPSVFGTVCPASLPGVPEGNPEAEDGICGGPWKAWEVCHENSAQPTCNVGQCIARFEALQKNNECPFMGLIAGVRREFFGGRSKFCHDTSLAMPFKLWSLQYGGAKSVAVAGAELCRLMHHGNTKKLTHGLVDFDLHPCSYPAECDPRHGGCAAALTRHMKDPAEFSRHCTKTGGATKAHTAGGADLWLWWAGNVAPEDGASPASGGGGEDDHGGETGPDRDCTVDFLKHFYKGDRDHFCRNGLSLPLSPAGSADPKCEACHKLSFSYGTVKNQCTYAGCDNKCAGDFKKVCADVELDTCPKQMPTLDKDKWDCDVDALKVAVVKARGVLQEAAQKKLVEAAAEAEVAKVKPEKICTDAMVPYKEYGCTRAVCLYVACEHDKGPSPAELVNGDGAYFEAETSREVWHALHKVAPADGEPL